MSNKIKNILKTLIYIYKEGITLFKNDSQAKIFYLHIPKCGGSSVDSTFRKHFAPSNTFKENSAAFNKGAATFFKDIENRRQLNIENNYYSQKYREAILLYSMYSEKYRYITGHFSFSDPAYELFKNQYHFITILRNPVKRFISEYFFKYKQKRHFPIEEELDSFINSPRGKEYGVKYVKMLGGLEQDADYYSKEAIQRAKENLEKFDIIGIMEDFDNFVKQVKDKLDLKLNIGHKNKSPFKAHIIEKKISKENMKKIKLLCQPDKEIYQFALKIYKK